MRVGIVGAGLVGRLLSWRLSLAGNHVTLFDKASQLGEGSAAYAAGGMLSLLAEQETAESIIYDLAKESLSLWEQWLLQLEHPVYFQKNGSLLIAHKQDRFELDHAVKRINRFRDFTCIRKLDRESLQKFEPELNFSHAYYLENEAQIDARNLLNALVEESNNNKVCCYFEIEVKKVSPGYVEINQKKLKFDWVLDCRGIGAQSDFLGLRAVRGELVYLYAPEVHLSRVVRLLHPRYRVYIIPRSSHLYLIGATEIEAFDESSISVRTCLELLSAAYSVHKGFAEARILETVTAMRTAFPDNLPRIFYQPGLIGINGLYRHGFLIAPAIVNDVIEIIKDGIEVSNYPTLVHQGVQTCISN